MDSGSFDLRRSAGDELRVQYDDFAPWRILAFEQGQRNARSLCADLIGVLIHARKGNSKIRVVMQITATYNGDVLGNAQTVPKDYVDRADRGRVVVAKNSIRFGF